MTRTATVARRARTARSLWEGMRRGEKPIGVGGRDLATAVLRQSLRAEVDGISSGFRGNPGILRTSHGAALALHRACCRSARRAVIPRTLPREGWNGYAESRTHDDRDAALWQSCRTDGEPDGARAGSRKLRSAGRRGQSDGQPPAADQLAGAADGLAQHAGRGAELADGTGL